jgi:hypothetical protein
MPGPKSKGTSFPALKPGIVLILYRKLSNRLLVKFCHMDI